MKSKRFSIEFSDKYNLYIPETIFKPFAEAKQNRVRIIASFNTQQIEFYAAVKKDKNSGDYKLMFSKEKQKNLGLLLNDHFDLQLFEDTSKYGVDMPEELDAVLLSDYDAYQIFESLTKGKQRSIIYGIIRIKKSQTRIDKALHICEMLKRGVTNPMELFKAKYH